MKKMHLLLTAVGLSLFVIHPTQVAIAGEQHGDQFQKGETVVCEYMNTDQSTRHPIHPSTCYAARSISWTDRHVPATAYTDCPSGHSRRFLNARRHLCHLKSLAPENLMY